LRSAFGARFVDEPDETLSVVVVGAGLEGIELVSAGGAVLLAGWLVSAAAGAGAGAGVVSEVDCA
jgi:hypothetical protein